MIAQAEIFGGVPEARSLRHQRAEREEVLAIARRERQREEEEQKMREAKARLRRECREVLDRIRDELVKIYRYRMIRCGDGHPEVYVTADDARLLIRKDPKTFGLPASNNALGSLFQHRDWEPIDTDARGRAIATHVSATEGARSNRLVRWRYVGDRL